MRQRSRTPWLWFVHLAGVAPGAWMLVNLIRGVYFIDPISALLIRTGRTALAFIFLSLACTPLSFVLGFNRLVLARRPLGLYALFYAVGHAGVFIGWDYGLDLALLWQAIAYQPFVVVGAVGLVILIGLGVTSLAAIRRSMGRWWRPVQRSVYLSAILIVLHVMWQAKDPWEAGWAVVILVVLLGVRLPWIRRGIVRVRKMVSGSGSEA